MKAGARGGLPRADPFYFGPPDRPLLGWLHRAADGAPSRDIGVVLCNPFGHEAMSAHRSIRHAAQVAARLGCPALRFDFDGMGDSAGDDLDPDRMAAWLRSIDEAIAALRAASGVQRVVLLGVRLGATLAALATSARDDIVGLALIAPVARGRPWLRELRALQAAMGLPEPPAAHAIPKGATESVGLLIPEAAVAEISVLDLGRLERSSAAHVLLIDRDDRPAQPELAAHFVSLGSEVRHEVLPGFVEMMLDPHDAAPPAAMIASWGDWLGKVAESAGATRDRERREMPAARRVARVSAGVEEEVVFLGADRRLVGIRTVPVGKQRPRRAMLLLNSGANHHVGSGRMNVKFARRLAELGWITLRYDVSGIGESLPREGATENEVYTSNAGHDLADAIATLAADGPLDRIEAMGICSGAYHGFKGAVAGLPLTGINVINPLVFFWKDGMSLAYPSYELARSARNYGRSVRDLGAWGRLLRGQVDMRNVGRVAIHQASARASRIARGIARAAGRPLPEDLGSELEAIAARGTALRFIFSTGDPGETLLRQGGDRVLDRLVRRGQVEIEYLPDCDHSLSASWMHELLWSMLTRELLES